MECSIKVVWPPPRSPALNPSWNSCNSWLSCSLPPSLSPVARTKASQLSHSVCRRRRDGSMEERITPTTVTALTLLADKCWGSKGRGKFLASCESAVCISYESIGSVSTGMNYAQHVPKVSQRSIHRIETSDNDFCMSESDSTRLVTTILAQWGVQPLQLYLTQPQQQQLRIG